MPSHVVNVGYQPACLPLDCLTEIKGHHANLDALELPGSHKEIIVGLVEAYFKNREKGRQARVKQEDQGLDFIRAKGTYSSQSCSVCKWFRNTGIKNRI
jgi:hypothetical protein